MDRIILRNINFFLLFLLCLPLVSLQTTVFKYSVFKYVQPNFLLIIVAYLGLRRFMIEGTALSLLLGHILEIHSGIPAGTLPLVFVFLFFVSKVIRQTVFIPNIFSVILFVMFISFLEKMFLLILLLMVGSFPNLWTHILLMTLPDAIVNGIIAPTIFSLLLFFDRITFKDLRFDGEYDINKEFEA